MGFFVQAGKEFFFCIPMPFFILFQWLNGIVTGKLKRNKNVCFGVLNVEKEKKSQGQDQVFVVKGCVRLREERVHGQHLRHDRKPFFIVDCSCLL